MNNYYNFKYKILNSRYLKKINTNLSHFLFNNVQLEQISDPEIIRQFVSSIPSTHPCKTEELHENIGELNGDDTTFFLTTIHNGEKVCYGFVELDINPKFYIQDTPFFYINRRCSWGKNIDSNLTWGRILWCNILKKINELCNNCDNFVVYNESIIHDRYSSKGYHEKMGMKSFDKMFDSEYGMLVENEIRKIASDLFLNNDEIFTQIKDKGLFYKKRKGINYNDIQSIFFSLPFLKFGGTIKRNKKTKTRNRKTKTKDRNRKKKSNKTRIK